MDVAVDGHHPGLLHRDRLGDAAAILAEIEFGVGGRGEDVVVVPVAVGKGDRRAYRNDEQRGGERLVRLRHLERSFRHLVDGGGVLEVHDHLIDGRRRSERRPHDDHLARDRATLDRGRGCNRSGEDREHHRRAADPRSTE